MLMGGLVNSMDDGGSGLWLQTACVSNKDITGNQVRRTPFQKAILIINFAGANNSTVFIDSAENNPITAYGNAKIQTAGEQYGLFDGAGDYLSVNRAEGWYLGDNVNDKFTVEAFVSFNSTKIAHCIASQYVGYGGPQNSWSFVVYDNNLYFIVSENGIANPVQFSTAFTYNVNQIYHLVFEKTNSLYLIYIDGILMVSFLVTTPMFISNQPLLIGKMNGFSYDLDGKIYGLRISKRAVYNADESSFTVPSLPFI